MAAHRYVELSHVISHDMTTLPGLPGPQLSVHLSREDSRGRYGPGTEFEIGAITMVGNTGTYLDSPYHRFADGHDLSGFRLDQLVDVPAVVVRVDPAGERGVGPEVLESVDVAEMAVLLHTGDDARFGSSAYVENAHFLTREGAEWLVDHGAGLVGIDAANIDDMSDPERPAHTALLAAGIPLVEHLTGLAHLPQQSFTFTAVPPRVERFTTFPVRAFATVTDS